VPNSPTAKVPASETPPRRAARSNGVPARALALILIVGAAIVVSVIGTVYVLGTNAQPVSSSRPVVAFSSPEPVPNGFAFQVEGVSESRGASNFRINFQVNDTNGFALPLAPVMPFTIGGTTYTVAWTDADGGGRLTTDDRLEVRAPGGVAPQTTYSVLLFWKDGNLIQSAPWPP